MDFSMNKITRNAGLIFVLLLTLSMGIEDVHAQSKDGRNVVFPSNELVIAHKGATGVIRTRMDHMKAMGTEIKKIGTMIRGKRPFDGSQIAAASERIIGHGHKFNGLFPEGTWKEPSRASLKIWKDWGSFTLAMNKMVRAATILAESGRAGNSSQVKAAYRALGKSCSGCHRIYRVKKKRPR